jgi:biotin carboxylase
MEAEMTTRRAAAQRPLLLVIGIGMRQYREYLLHSISSRFDVHLFHSAEPAWGQEYLSGWSVLPSTLDGRAMARAALAVAENMPISGVLCWSEDRIHAASQVAEALGLRNGDPATILRLRDKGQTRAALASAGVPQPRSFPVRTPDQASAAAERIGYPVVLKPRDLGASLGVVRVDGPEHLAEEFSFTWNTRGPEAAALGSDGSILVEECVTGEEISVDSVVQDGTLTPLFIGRKVVGYPPYAEEIGHYVHAGDPLLTDPVLLTVLQNTHKALGFLDGCTHTEIMLTDSGPKVIEVNGRLGGDMIPYLGMRATGIDPGVVAASVACGLPPDLTATSSRVAGVRFFYVEQEDTTIASLAFHDQGLPEAVDRLVPLAREGAVVSPPPKGTWWGRVAFATAVADSFDECAQAIAAAEAALEIRAA